jgi:hypothetical protein
LTGDYRIWDWRIVLLSLITAITARMTVLVTLYPQKVDTRGLCPEIRRYTKFLGLVIQRLLNNIVPKLDYSAFEKANPMPWLGSPTSAFHIGAVDLTTGASDFIMVGADLSNSNNLLLAVKEKLGLRPPDPRPTEQPTERLYQFGLRIHPDDVAPTITLEDVHNAIYRGDRTALFRKQGAFAKGRLEDQLPVIQILQLAASLWELCPARDQITRRYLSPEMLKIKDAYYSLIKEGGDSQKIAQALHLLSALEPNKQLVDSNLFRLASRLSLDPHDEILTNLRRLLDLPGIDPADTYGTSET